MRFASDILLEPFQDRFDILGISNSPTAQISSELYFLGDFLSIRMLIVKSNASSSY